MVLLLNWKRPPLRPHEEGVMIISNPSQIWRNTMGSFYRPTSYLPLTDCIVSFWFRTMTVIFTFRLTTWKPTNIVSYITRLLFQSLTTGRFTQQPSWHITLFQRLSNVHNVLLTLYERRNKVSWESFLYNSYARYLTLFHL